MTCANRMLGSADSEHIDSSDQLAAKKLMMVMNAKGTQLPMLNCCYFTVCWWKKSTYIHAVLSI